MNKTIGIVIYNNPDYYPPVINAIKILSKEFNLVVICRSQNEIQLQYGENIKLYRLGRQKTSKAKEDQNFFIKFFEFVFFVGKAISIAKHYHFHLIYAYDMHGLLAGFLAARIGKGIKIIYHSLELNEFKDLSGLSYLIKYLEGRLVHYVEKVVICDINRARYFQKVTRIIKLPDVVMNTPLTINKLPENKLNSILMAKGFSNQAKVVLYQGALNKDHFILEIIRSMSSWPEDSLFVLMGYSQGNFMDFIWKEAETLQLNSRIIQLPFINYNELFHYSVGAYLGMALYSNKNYNQTFNAGASNKIFEYLSMGVPIVTNKSPYFSEVLDSSVAYFVDPNSIEDISGAVNLAFQDPENHRRKSEAARKQHLTKFNYERQFRPILDYIKQLI